MMTENVLRTLAEVHLVLPRLFCDSKDDSARGQTTRWIKHLMRVHKLSDEFISGSCKQLIWVILSIIS